MVVALVADSRMGLVCVNTSRPFTGPIRIRWYHSIPPFLNEKQHYHRRLL